MYVFRIFWQILGKPENIWKTILAQHFTFRVFFDTDEPWNQSAARQEV